MDKYKIKNKDSKLKTSLLENRNLIIEHLKQEWEEAEEALTQKKKKERLIKFAKDVGITAGRGLLTLLVIGGVLTVVAVAPNVFAAYGHLTKQRRYFKKEQFNEYRYYLKRRGLIKIEKRGQDNFEITLTEKGAHKSLEEAFKNFKIQKSQKDGYWRVVMFDIPRKHNWARDAFRQKLREMGFYQFQESVFVMPYPCEKEINLLVAIFNISPFVYLIKTKDFSENKELKKVFD